jgi:hypothetical protein
VLTHCDGLSAGVRCEEARPITGNYGRTLSNGAPLPVLVACPVPAGGRGQWANHVRLDLHVPDRGAGLLWGADPLHWTANVTLTLSEDPDRIGAVAVGCPQAP